MKKILFIIGCWLLVTASYSQNVSQKLQKAFQQFESDSQLKHAISSLYVIDAKTGEVVFDKNSQVGLAPASTQKIITSVTAFELLGKDYRYKTEVYIIGRMGKINKGKLYGALAIQGYGDPTLGSFRFTSEKKGQFFDSILFAMNNKGIDTIYGAIQLHLLNYEYNSIPDGWIWQDIGNYYGAGNWPINWNENQFDVILSSKEEAGKPVSVVKLFPEPSGEYGVYNLITAGQKGSGDNAYVYLPVNSKMGVFTGTIPVGEKSFKITGTIPNPPEFIGDSLRNYLATRKVFIKEKGIQILNNYPISDRLEKESELFKELVYTHYSPSLDSIIYWFLKKSINLYGEALIKTFAYEKQGFGSTDSGVAIVRKFWKEKGLDADELNIYDGSGLSPLNRVTTHVQVEILKYAKTRGWFPYFYNSLPEYNSMKMKSGTISDVKGFCGYQKSKDGKEYIFSFLVNNYRGKSSGVVNKMYKVLDELK